MSTRSFTKYSAIELEDLYREKGEVESVRKAILLEEPHRRGKRAKKLFAKIHHDWPDGDFPSPPPPRTPPPSPPPGPWPQAAETENKLDKVLVLCQDCQTPNFVFDQAGIQYCSCSSCRRPFVATKGEGAMVVTFPELEKTAEPKTNWLTVAILVALVLLTLVIFLK